MFGAAWWLGLGREPDPASAAARLRKKVGSVRMYTLIMVGVAVGSAWSQSAQARGAPIPWSQLSFALCWGVLVLMALMMPAVAGHPTWPPARRRMVTRLVWLAAVLLVVAGAWDLGLFNDRRFGIFWAWVGLFLGFGIGFGLLGLLGWFTLAGVYLSRLAACHCPPPMKRWMRTAPLPRSLAGPHECPRPAEPAATQTAA